MNNLKIVQWNANGLHNHKLELELYLNTNNIDIMLICETHLTSKHNFKIFGYTCYANNHPEDKPCGGTAILIKSRISHQPLPNKQTKHLQYTAIRLTEQQQKLTIISVYCPPKYAVKTQHFENFFNTFDSKFLMAGDFNAKSPVWGSRLTSPKGKQLLQAIRKQNLNCTSGGSPTYWPTDRRKIPDVIDLVITKNIALDQIALTTTMDLSSDHSPTTINFAYTSTKFSANNKAKTYTNWIHFQKAFKTTFNPNMKLKTKEDIDNGLNYLQSTIEDCLNISTTQSTSKSFTLHPHSPNILDLLTRKRQARRKWQVSRSPAAKKEVNDATKLLKKELADAQNKNIQDYVSHLTHLPDSHNPIWKTIRNTKKPMIRKQPIKNNQGKWIIEDKDKSEEFAIHLELTFTNNSPISPPEAVQGPLNKQDPITFKLSQISKKINELNTKKSPGPDSISAKALRSLSLSGHEGILYLFNAITQTSYYPSAWKQAKIILIPKPGKDLTKINSYRPISLLSILSKVFEKLLMEHLNSDIDKLEIIPQHQFGFRRHHSTIEQVHRVVNEIKNALENKSYCTGIFLDVSQAFDRVNHNGLLYKIYSLLPIKYHKILTSYLNNRTFQVQFGNETSSIRSIKAGVPQGSVLGPLLYLLFTCDLPTNENITTTTFADDTAILCSNRNLLRTHRQLQAHMDSINDWCEKWGIKLNEDKSVQITFTLRKDTCPSIKINNKTIPQRKSAKYLGIHLDRRLTWHEHITKKKEQINITYKKLHWLLNKNSKLNTETKLILYKSIIKPIWTYGIQLWGSAKQSNLNIIERSQSKIIRSILGAPKYVRNSIILRDTNTDTVGQVAMKLSDVYKYRLVNHPNKAARKILKAKRYNRLKRNDPLNLAN